VKLTIHTNGHPVNVQASQRKALHTVIPVALAGAGYEGWAVDNWELRKADGQLLDTSKPVSAYGFGDGAVLYLNLRAGVGG
jgi:hypothetical protein